MAFRFTSGAYHFPKAWTAEQKTHGLTILKLGVQTGARPKDMMKMMHKAGVSYRKTWMLQDIGRAQGIEQAKTVGAYKRAEQWYDQSETVRKTIPGNRRKDAADFMDRWKTESWETIEEAERATGFEAEGGCPSPPC